MRNRILPILTCLVRSHKRIAGKLIRDVSVAGNGDDRAEVCRLRLEQRIKEILAAGNDLARGVIGLTGVAAGIGGNAVGVKTERTGDVQRTVDSSA